MTDKLSLQRKDGMKMRRITEPLSCDELALTDWRFSGSISNIPNPTAYLEGIDDWLARYEEAFRVYHSKPFLPMFGMIPSVADIRALEAEGIAKGYITEDAVAKPRIVYIIRGVGELAYFIANTIYKIIYILFTERKDR